MSAAKSVKKLPVCDWCKTTIPKNLKPIKTEVIWSNGIKLNFHPDCEPAARKWKKENIKFSDRTWTDQGMPEPIVMDEQVAAIIRARKFAKELYRENENETA